MPFPVSGKYSAAFFAVMVFVIFPFFNFKSTLDPETIWRTTALGILAVSFLLYYFIKVIKDKSCLFPFWKNRVFIFFSLYAVVSSLSLIRSINPGDGIFDVLKLYLYLGILVIVTRLLIERNGALDIIIKTINISVALFSIFGCIQLINLLNEASDFHQTFKIGQSLKSTLGNKNTYSEVLFLSLPFCIYGIIIYTRLWKIFCLFNAVLILASIIVLMNLYVWLALLIMISAVLIVLIGSKENRSLKRAAVLSFIGLMVIVCTLFLKIANTPSIKSKLNNVFNYMKHPENIGQHNPAINDNNVHERLVLVKNSAEMIKENWLIGVGIGNWKIMLPKYGMVSMTGNIRPDYAHNDYLTVLSETGIVGLLCYILMLFFAMKGALKLYRKSEDNKLKTIALLMFAGVFGFAIISFFGFTKEKFFPMLLLMIMIAVVISNLGKETGNEEGRQKWHLFLLPFLAAIIFFLVAVGITRISSEVHLMKAMKAKKFQQWDEAISEAGKSDSWFYPLDYSATPIKWYKGISYLYENKTDSALVYLKLAERVNPYHVQLLNDIGTCYENKNMHTEAINYFEKAFELDPYLVRENLVAAYFNAGQVNKAFALSVNTRYEKTVFLEEILRAKAMRVYSAYGGDKEALLKKIETKGWLIRAFESSKLLNITFEEAIVSEK